MHLHTDDSIRDGLCVADKLAERLAKIGQPGCAITDHGSMSACYKASKIFKKHGLKLVPGIEAYLVDNVTQKETQKQQSHITLLAETNTGYHNLCEMLSIASMNYMHYGKPRVDYNLLAQHCIGVVALSGCVKSIAMKKANDGDVSGVEKYLSKLCEIFGHGNVYAEAQLHESSTRQSLEIIQSAARKVDIPVVATNDVHFLEKDDYATHQIIAALSHGRSLRDLAYGFQYPREIYLKSASEMEKTFDGYVHAVHRTKEVFDRCNVDMNFGGSYMPRFLEDGDEHEFLKTLVRNALIRKKLGKKTEYVERVKYEMRVIKKLGFAGYFLIVWDMMRWGREQGISFGCGRGSVGGSLVCYLLDIHSVDPIKYGLIFERFINPERVSPPDIDTDIEDVRRGEMVNYISQKYGAAYNIVTFSRMYGRSAIRDICRVMDIPLFTANQIAAAYPEAEQGNHVLLERALEKSPDLRRFATQPKYTELFKHIGSLEKICRHIGVHAAGTVIVPKDVSVFDFCPLRVVQSSHKNFETGKSEKSQSVCVGVDMKDVDSIGLMKIDLLGSSVVTIIADVCKKNDVDISAIPMDDASVYKQFETGDTIGVFQCAEQGIRGQFRQMKPKNFDDVTFMVSAWRPGPMSLLPECYDIRFGRKQPPKMHPILDKILKETYYSCVYQEQLMSIVREIAGFSMAESDSIRRAIGKKDKDLLFRQQEKFVQGCLNAKTLNEAEAVKMFETIKKFAGYGFNLSHGCAYALNAYRTAYLKYHHMADFYAATATANQGDLAKTAELFDDADCHGIKILSPNVLTSGIEFFGNGDSVVYALSKIKNVGLSAARHIVEARERVGFTTLSEFLSSVDRKIVDRRVLTSLVKSGALDCFGYSRTDLICSVEQMLGYMKSCGDASKFVDVFGVSGKDDLSIHVSNQETPPMIYAMNEISALGMRIDDKIFDAISALSRRPEVVLQSKYNIRAIARGEHKEGKTLLIGCVDKYSEFLDKKKRPARSILLSDWRQIIRVGFYGDACKEVPDSLMPGNIVAVSGRVVTNRVFADKIKIIETSRVEEEE